MRFLAFAPLLASAAAFAQQPYVPPPIVTSGSPQVSAPPPAEDGPGSGFQIDLGLLGAGGIFNFLCGPGCNGVLNNAGNPSSSLLTPAPGLDVGYQWNQNALLLDLDLNAMSGPTFLFGIAPTYRRYFSPLKTGGFSAFGEGSLAFVILAPNVGSSSFGFGFDGGIGGEWLFIKNFALFAKGTLGYVHAGNGGLNFDGIGLAATAGLTLHL
jgi:hypothetical protein